MEKQLPKNWVNTELKKVSSELHQGVNTTGEKLVYSETGYPVLQAKHISSGSLKFDDTKFIDQETYDKYSKSHNPLFGDVLLTNIGTIGKSLVFRNEEKLLIA